jgi:hypothetical protein
LKKNGVSAGGVGCIPRGGLQFCGSAGRRRSEYGVACPGHFRVGLSGSRILDARFALASLLSFPAAADWSCRMQTWPKDVDLRRNMMTTGWKDLATLIASKDVVITLAETNKLVASKRVQQGIQESGAGAAVRFAVTVGEDQTVNLQLQGLPAPANNLMGKPATRGYEHYK